jgi:uncharacterized membrane protein
MAKDLTSKVGDLVAGTAKGAVSSFGNGKPSGGAAATAATGLIAGVGLAAAAKKGVDAVRSSAIPSAKGAVKNAASTAGDKVGDRLENVASDKIDEAGGAGGMVKDAVGGMLPFGGGNDKGGGDAAMAGVGKGRRMPVQQDMDIGCPLETVYNQWTQYETWPEFMHRVVNVSQEDECTVHFSVKIWGKTKEFTAKIETQRPDERVKWTVEQGMNHTGVVTFHELAPNLTRVLVDLDVDPGSLAEKFARGARLVKRAVRGDLHRLKAFIELQEEETGAWRGVIEDGELVEDHDESYDEDREYSEIEMSEDEEEPEEDEESEEEEEEEEEPVAEEDEEYDDEEPEEEEESQRERSERFREQAERSRARSRGGSSRSRSRSRSRA